MKIHAICLALNEAAFIAECIKPLYNVCSGISVITQYDRDYYSNKVVPDDTVNNTLSIDDPAGKIHLVVRRFKDETAARNHEMLSLLTRPERKIESHGVPLEEIRQFYESPDYFLIVDADEIYDAETIGNIVDFLERKKPAAMRVTAYQYLFTWNQRIPLDTIRHHQFGFVKSGHLFEMRRVLDKNEYRIRNLLNKLRLPDFSDSLLGYIDCPLELGMFHHGSYLGGLPRLKDKFAKHSHREVNNEAYIQSIEKLPYDLIPTGELPVNIRNGVWPAGFFSDPPKDLK